MKRLYASLIVVILLAVLGLWTSEGAKSELKPQTTPNLQDEKMARKKATFKKGRELLLQKNVPFDPDQLLKRGWQQRLKTTLDQMPELQVIEQGDNKLKGAQLAHTLYLPENVQLTGDTVILAKVDLLARQVKAVAVAEALAVHLAPGAKGILEVREVPAPVVTAEIPDRLALTERILLQTFTLATGPVSSMKTATVTASASKEPVPMPLRS